MNIRKSAGGLSAGLWHGPLQALGFNATYSGHLYYRDGLVFSVDDGWGSLRAEWQPGSTDPLEWSLGQGNPWKAVADRNAGQLQLRWELPPTLLAAADPRLHGEDGDRLFRTAVAWGIATAGGEPVADWQAPSPQQVDGVLPVVQRTIQAGHLLRQVTVVNEPGRLILTCPVVQNLPADLPDSQRYWLGELLLDAQNRWKLIKVGRCASGSLGVELAATGIPEEMSESYLRTGMEILRYAVKSLIREADFLATGTESCRALEVLSPRAVPAN